LRERSERAVDRRGDIWPYFTIDVESVTGLKIPH